MAALRPASSLVAGPHPVARCRVLHAQPFEGSPSAWRDDPRTRATHLERAQHLEATQAPAAASHRGCATRRVLGATPLADLPTSPGSVRPPQPGFRPAPRSSIRTPNLTFEARRFVWQGSRDTAGTLAGSSVRGVADLRGALTRGSSRTSARIWCSARAPAARRGGSGPFARAKQIPHLISGSASRARPRKRGRPGAGASPSSRGATCILSTLGPAYRSG